MARPAPEIAETLIDHADVVVFVTSTLRYADSVPWEVLRRAVSRGATVINVLNRYSGESSGAYVDLQSRLGAAGIETDVLRVPEHYLGDGQAVPALAVRELARRLVEVGRDRRGHQQEVLNRVLDSTLDQAREISTTLSGDVRWVEAEDESIRARFQGAASYLDLSRVATLVDTGFPYGSSPRKKKRWARKFTPHAEFEDDAVVVVDTDIRRLGYHASDLGPMIHRTLTGWSDFVRRVSAEVPKVRSDLGRAVLMQACLDESEVEPAVYLFGDEAQILVLRVRRDLIERLQVVYTHAGERLVEQHHEQVGEPDSAVLDERIAAVVARSHFADA